MGTLRAFANNNVSYKLKAHTSNFLANNKNRIITTIKAYLQHS